MVINRRRWERSPDRDIYSTSRERRVATGSNAPSFRKMEEILGHEQQHVPSLAVFYCPGSLAWDLERLHVFGSGYPYLQKGCVQRCLLRLLPGSKELIQ